MYTILFFANHSISLNNLSSEPFLTFEKVALPQSQNVQRNGHPLFVSHAQIQFIPGTFSTKSQIVFVKYGEGKAFKSSILSSGKEVKSLVLMPLIFSKSL